MFLRAVINKFGLWVLLLVLLKTEIMLINGPFQQCFSFRVSRKPFDHFKFCRIFLKNWLEDCIALIFFSIILFYHLNPSKSPHWAAAGVVVGAVSKLRGGGKKQNHSPRLQHHVHILTPKKINSPPRPSGRSNTPLPDSDRSAGSIHHAARRPAIWHMQL